MKGVLTLRVYTNILDKHFNPVGENMIDQTMFNVLISLSTSCVNQGNKASDSGYFKRAIKWSEIAFKLTELAELVDLIETDITETGE